MEVAEAPKPDTVLPKLKSVGAVEVKLETLGVDCWPKLNMLVALLVPLFVERPDANGLPKVDAAPEGTPEGAPALEPGARRRLGVLMLKRSVR